VDGLLRYRVQYVVLSTLLDDWSEPNLSSVSSGVTHLDDYLRRNYEVCHRSGPHLAVWRRATGWENEHGVR
jgi:hypothetical protein